MLVNFDVPLIFLRPGKVAGTSAEMFLQQILWPGRLVNHEQRYQLLRNGFVTGRMELSRETTNLKNLYAFYWSRRYSALPSYGSMYRATKLGVHSGPDRVRAVLGETFWQQSFKVTIVRNPYDAAVSRFFWKNRDHQPKDIEAARQQFEVFVKQGNNAPINTEIPMSLGLFDRVIHYESLHSDFTALLVHLGIPSETLNSFPSAKAGIRPEWARDYQILYTNESRKAVEAHYKPAIESMEYTFD